MRFENLGKLWSSANYKYGHGSISSRIYFIAGIHMHDFGTLFTNDGESFFGVVGTFGISFSSEVLKDIADRNTSDI